MTTEILRAVFWTSLIVVAYTYVLYPILLFVVYTLVQALRDAIHLVRARDRRTRDLATDEVPPVSLIIPAFNERAHLPRKLENIRRVDYPRDRLQVIFVSDGSTDGTNALLESAEDPMLRAVFLPERCGKAQAVNRGVAESRTDILVLSDAATLFAPSAVRRLVRHFEDPRVGVVCGALRFEAGEVSRRTEGVYWKYERMLRSMEGRLGATLTASGAIYAVRRVCFRDLAPSVILDDFVVPMTARSQGFRVVYDSEAVATDFAAPSVAAEYERRVRIAEGSFRAIPQFLRIPLDLPATWAFVSHKLLRWILPVPMLLLLVSSGLLWSDWFHRAAFIAQVAFYVCALTGYLVRESPRVRGLLLPYYLTSMHLAYLVGFFRYVRGDSEGAWGT